MGVRYDSPHGVSTGDGGSRGSDAGAGRRRDRGREGGSVASGKRVFPMGVQTALPVLLLDEFATVSGSDRC